MKKLKSVLLIMVVALLLVGCGSEGEKEDTSKTFDKSVAKEKISALKFNDIEFTFTDSESIGNVDALKVYGVDKDLFEDYMVYLSNNITDPSMYLIVKPKDDKKSVVKYQIKDMFEKYYNSYSNYYPKEAKMIEDRLEKEYNGYLIYVVSYDNNSVYQAIQDSFK